jgi:hypothetical protein
MKKETIKSQKVKNKQYLISNLNKNKMKKETIKSQKEIETEIEILKTLTKDNITKEIIKSLKSFTVREIANAILINKEARKNKNINKIVTENTNVYLDAVRNIELKKKNVNYINLDKIIITEDNIVPIITIIKTLTNFKDEFENKITFRIDNTDIFKTEHDMLVNQLKYAFIYDNNVTEAISQIENVLK